MARSDLLLNLVKAGMTGDTAEVRETAEAIAADERAKRHLGVADRITRTLDSAESKAQSKNRQSQMSRSSLQDANGVMRRVPRRALSDLCLVRKNRSACDDLIDEQHRADLLRAYGLEPRHRILLSGPPGNGKTTLAEALAYELALPWFTVRYEEVITSYLGETAQRLKSLFDLVRTEPCVLFFDEFDTIGKERGDIHETGEIKRVVTSLLLQLDRLPSYCVLIGATNHPELLDRATWRRFELRLELGPPSTKQLISYFSEQLDRLARMCQSDFRPGYSAKRLCEAVSPASFSAAEEFFLDVNRRVVLAEGSRDLKSILAERVKLFASRHYSPSCDVSDVQPTHSSIS